MIRMIKQKVDLGNLWGYVTEDYTRHDGVFFRENTSYCLVCDSRNFKSEKRVLEHINSHTDKEIENYLKYDGDIILNSFTAEEGEVTFWLECSIKNYTVPEQFKKDALAALEKLHDEISEAHMEVITGNFKITLDDKVTPGKGMVELSYTENGTASGTCVEVQGWIVDG